MGPKIKWTHNQFAFGRATTFHCVGFSRQSLTKPELKQWLVVLQHKYEEQQVPDAICLYHQVWLWAIRQSNYEAPGNGRHPEAGNRSRDTRKHQDYRLQRPVFTSVVFVPGAKHIPFSEFEDLSGATEQACGKDVVCISDNVVHYLFKRDEVTDANLKYGLSMLATG